MNLHTIMLVDSDPQVQNLGRMSLEMIGGFSVLACDSGEEALDSIAEVQPDCILLEAFLPGVNGEETLRLFQKDPTTAAIPVIFMTTRLDAEEALRLRRLGAAGVIPKPLDPMTLPGEVYRLWGKMSEADTD